MPQETNPVVPDPTREPAPATGSRWWQRVRSHPARWRLGIVAAGLFLVIAAGAGTGRGPSADTISSRAGEEGDTGVTGSQPSAEPETTPTTTVAEPRSFTLVATGDVLLHSQLWAQAERDAAAGKTSYDFEPLLAGARPVVQRADLAVCHLETPLAAAGGPHAGYPSFSVPPEIAPALAATGYDACTTASNHIYDRGADGVDRTLDALDAAGLDHAGAARDPDEAARTTLLDAGEATVALLSYTFGFNGVPAPNGETWRSNMIDEARILADAAEARRLGADVVVVALHWGDEYVHEPSAQQEALARPLIRSPDVDLLLGHHSHVVQPIEAVDGEWIVYGMGNMVAYQGTLGATKEEGLLVRFTFTEADGGGGWQVTEAEFTALLTARNVSPVRLVDVGEALADPTVADVSSQRLQEAWDRTNDVVQQRGGDRHGPRPIHEP